MIYILLGLLLLLVVFSFLLNDRDIIAPAVLFSASITIGVLFASFYVKKWELNLHMNTFLVLLLGVFEFTMVSFLVKKLTIVRISDRKRDLTWKPQLIHIEESMTLLYIVFEILAIYYSIYVIVRLFNGSMSHFTESTLRYRDQNMFTSEKVALPTMASYTRAIVDAGGYWFGYVLINNYFVNRKINYKYVIIVLLSATSSYLLGGRNGIISMIVVLICSWFIISNKASSYFKTVKVSTIMKLLALTIVVLSSFESLAFLIGRTGFKSAQGIDYLAVYIGAPIKNLDTFLQGPLYKQSGFESQTFINLMNVIGPKLHLTNRIIVLDLPFRYVGTLTLGNVYTTFYAFIYDFGYRGVVILVALMAFISQSVYEFVRNSKRTFYPAYSNLIYAFMASTLIMSFFSNKFYEQIFNKGFVRMLIIWGIFDVVFCRIIFRQKSTVK